MKETEVDSHSHAKSQTHRRARADMQTMTTLVLLDVCLKQPERGLEDR